MKPLLVLGKIFLVACLWSLFFIEGIRVILLINWHFDIFWAPHWAYLWQLWHSGWVIDHAKEWAFILILLAAIPMWLTGWIFLSVVNWSKLFEIAILNPIRRFKSYLNDINAPARNDLAVKRVVKKRSYKEIRPNLQGPAPVESFTAHPVSVVIKEEDTEKEALEKPRPAKPASATSSSKSSVEEKKPFTHSVFDFDDDDDDFDLDFDYAVKSIREKQEQNKKDDYDEDSGEEENKKEKSSKSRAFDDFENDIRDEDFDDYNDEDDEFEDERPSKKGRQKQHRNDFDDEDDDFDRPQKREDNRRNRNAERRENHRDRDEKDSRQSKNSKNDRRDADRRNDQPRKSDVGNPIVDTLRQKGYEIISGVNIKNTYIDYIAVDANSMYLCLVDKEVGDWLADEERFNDEEPLWFSETNHRVSPVRMVDIARNVVAKKLRSCKITLDLKAFVIIQNGNIINAEDMFEVWRGIDVYVTRINRGAPREIPLFSKSVDDVSHRIDSLRFESLKKLIRSLG